VTAPILRRTPLEPLVRQIESASLLDAPAKQIGRFVRGSVPAGPVKDALSGTWLGHAVHPMLTDIVIGSFTSATLLDVVGPRGDGRAARRLIALGLLAYGPTAASGVSDWADSEPADDGVRRAGLVHAACNGLGASMYADSLLARRRGKHARGALLGLAGFGVMGVGAYLGGHLSLSKGVGPDQTVFDPGPTDWIVAADASQLPEHRPQRMVVDDTPVVMVRDGDRIFAIHDRCSHRGCSLSDGELEGEEIVCGCHGSRFSLRDGSVKRGPATAPQPAFQVRVSGDRVEVRRLQPGLG